MYKIASENKQRRESFIPLKAIAGGEEQRSAQDIREDLGREIQALERQIMATRDKVQKKALGLQKLALQNKVHALGLKVKYRDQQSLSQCFVDSAKEVLSQAQFKMILARALRLQEERSVTPTPMKE